MSHPILAAHRAAHVARCEAAYNRVLSGIASYGAGLPNRLISAGCWLVSAGDEGDASPAEKALGWGPNRYRQFLATLDPDARAAEVEDGRRVMFEGRNPVVVQQRMAA